VGEHNEEVLGLLGYSEPEIAALYAGDVIGNRHHYDEVPG
jgi:crotonobetainyl-CoA:carnitine CoA-transferase CaiB-like acyl-CoA transferase